MRLDPGRELVPRMFRSDFRRIPSVGPCEVEYREERRAATTRNISVRGVYLAIDPVPAVDERIRLSVRLPGTDEPVRAIGRIAWQNRGAGLKDAAVAGLPAGCGVEFLAIAEGDRRRIQEHIEAAAGPDPVP